MTVAEEQDQFEKEKAEQFIAETPPMPGVEPIRIDFGRDHTGDPSMWLVFRVSPDLDFDWDAAGRFNEYVGVIQTKILHAGLKRFPYTRLEQTGGSV
jgi:hypothetical protein